MVECSLSDIMKSDLIKAPHKTPSLLVHQYFHTLQDLLDKHAPVQERTIPQHDVKGFMDTEILKAKRLKRKLEREWRKTNTAQTRSRYRTAVNNFNSLLERSKTKHYCSMINDHKDDPKAL